MTRSEAGKLGAAVTSPLIRKKAFDRYYANPNICCECNHIIKADESKSRPFVIAREKKFCTQSCAATYSNKHRVLQKKKNKVLCVVCGLPINSWAKKYCSLKCQGIERSRIAVNVASVKTVIPPKCHHALRRALIRKHGANCWKCGWGEVNLFSQTVPLVLNHIDGDSGNCEEINLEMLCPNCDSLTSTYKGLNRGKGRHSRRQRYKEGKSY